MTLIAIYARACSCGHDVARMVVSDGSVFVECAPDRGGCGAAGPRSVTEGAAVAAWNRNGGIGK